MLRSFSRQVTTIVAAAVLFTGCDRSDFYPVLDVPLSPTVGKFQSPNFSIDSSSVYAIAIGTDGAPVDEATCRAAARAGPTF
jgi:hypothetical protein